MTEPKFKTVSLIKAVYFIVNITYIYLKFKGFVSYIFDSNKCSFCAKKSCVLLSHLAPCKFFLNKMNLTRLNSNFVPNVKVFVNAICVSTTIISIFFKYMVVYNAKHI